MKLPSAVHNANWAWFGGGLGALAGGALAAGMAKQEGHQGKALVGRAMVGALAGAATGAGIGFGLDWLVKPVHWTEISKPLAGSKDVRVLDLDRVRGRTVGFDGKEGVKLSPLPRGARLEGAAASDFSYGGPGDGPHDTLRSTAAEPVKRFFLKTGLKKPRRILFRAT